MQPQPPPIHPADHFSNLAYRCVSAGIIRLEDRRQLARAAVHLGIRPFEAQLLIACAIRQKALDDGPASWQGRPARRVKLEPQRPSRMAAWKTVAILAATAASLDTLLIYLWLS